MLIDRFILQIVDFSPSVQDHIIDQWKIGFAKAAKIKRADWPEGFCDDIATFLANEYRTRLAEINEARGNT